LNLLTPVLKEPDFYIIITNTKHPNIDPRPHRPIQKNPMPRHNPFKGSNLESSNCFLNILYLSNNWDDQLLAAMRLAGVSEAFIAEHFTDNRWFTDRDHGWECECERCIPPVPFNNSWSWPQEEPPCDCEWCAQN
jgi:hypothetical protein